MKCVIFVTSKRQDSMSEVVLNRVARLRELMRREKLDAFIFPSTDAHNGEYVPDHWKGREYISGFNGSAGTAVVTMDDAALWTDSRYFLAAGEQLKGTGYRLMKLKMEGTPTIAQWLGQKLAPIDGAQVGVDGMVNSINTVRRLVAELRRQGGITVRTNFDPLSVIWTDRPSIPQDGVSILPLEYAGESAGSKLSRIRARMREKNVDGMLVSALDDIAWTLNMRGSDVRCNPVFVAYLLIGAEEATLYIDEQKISSGTVADYLRSVGVRTDHYNNVAKGIKAFGGYNILMDPDETSYALYKAWGNRPIEEDKSPIPAMKAVKNPTEIEGYRRAMVSDGIAMVRFLRWLRPAVRRGGVTEMGVDKKLTSLRAEQPLFKGNSFDTIVGYGPHGAIVHYEATPESDVELKPRGFVLIDSGGQYMCGTTDITRTIALGEPTDEERHIYTLVLKGHIAMEMCKFPANASGTQIDILARAAMWREGYNYLHGTGHGVGCFLNVHEGPHQVRMEWVAAQLKSGMTVTDEPGLYLAGKFGVRTENTLLIREYKTTEFGHFLEFEPLTLCPIDKTPIDRSMLWGEEVEWLDAYHRMVYEKLSPYLGEEEREWLKGACAPL